MEKRDCNMSKQETWLKTRHRVITTLLKPAFGLYIRWKYGITVEPFKDQGDRQYLVLYNHQTAFDQFFVALTIANTCVYNQ